MFSHGDRESPDGHRPDELPPFPWGCAADNPSAANRVHKHPPQYRLPLGRQQPESPVLQLSLIHILPVKEVETIVKESLEAVGLSGFSSRSPHALSGGEKRKLAIAGILAMKPKIIIFDEPFTGLDYPGVVQVLKQIVQLHKNCLLYTSCDLSQFRQAEHLKTAAICQDRARPVHKTVQPSCCSDDLHPRPQVEVVGIGKDDLSP